MVRKDPISGGATRAKSGLHSGRGRACRRQTRRRWAVYSGRVSTPSPGPEQLRLLNDLVQSRLQLQTDELDSLDRKATTVLAGTGVLLGLVVNNVATFATSVSPVPPWLFYASLVCLAPGLLAGLWTLWPRREMDRIRPTFRASGSG